MTSDDIYSRNRRRVSSSSNAEQDSKQESSLPSSPVCDRLCSHNHVIAARTPPQTLRRSGLNNLKLEAGKRVVKKYKRFARNAEYRRLKSIVPSLASKQDVSKAEILDEAIQYIDSLHKQLVDSIQNKGLPTSLETFRADRSKDKSEPVPSKELSARETIELVQSALQPDIERRLTARRRLDDMAVHTLLKHVTDLPESSRDDDDEEESPCPSSSSSTLSKKKSCQK